MFQPSRTYLLTILLSLSCSALRADEPNGAMVYAKKCASCHGKAGEGTKTYDHPLVGSRSLEQLTKYIARKMPEDAPGTCTGPEAEKVSAFIFGAFYSPAAQARLKAPRLELARLTVNEYRNAIADVVGSVRATKGKSDDRRGLRAEYFNRDAKRARTLAFERLEPVVHFDFADARFEKLKTPEIAAEWQGSVVAPETGMYDFIVKTEHSTRFWVNDMKKPLIDAAVKSGDDVEFRGSLFLLAGHAYPLKLEFSRASLGVRKDPKEKLATVKTTMALAWKAPRRPVEVIPEQALRPTDAPTSFAITVALPADDRSAGYERGNAVSKAWVQATADGAIETANYVANHLGALSGVDAGNPKRRALLQDYCAAFAQRAFRRPLTPEQRKFIVERQFELAKDDDTAVKRVVLLVLQSPRFLYREPGATSKTPGDAFDTASRLSFALWDSIPDRTLLDAAATGKLTTRDNVVREAKRMLAEPRAQAKLHAFLLQWLKLDQITELPKDAKIFPTFDAAVVADLQTSLDLYLDDVVGSKTSDFRQFFQTEDLYLNGRLAALYGIDLPADAPFQKVSVKAGERKGLLTHPYILANLSYPATSSPIHRGVFLARNILGVNLRQPPDAFTPLAAELHPKLNTRERITLQTRAKDCQGCHNVINPLGFTLEHFDAIGRRRDTENGKPIDSTGAFITRSGDTAPFSGVADLAKFLAASDEVQEAFVARLFHALVKQPILAYGPTKLDDLRRRFTADGCNIRNLAIEIIADTAGPR